MKTKTLLCDIDGCLADWNTGFLKLLQQLHGVKERTPFIYAMQGWNWPQALGYTHKEIDQAWSKVDHNWWYNLEPYPGAEEAILRLSNLRGVDNDANPEFQVYFITGRHAKAQHASIDWLMSQGFCCPSVITSSWKSRFAEAFAIDGPVAVIEDKPGIIVDYCQSHKVDHLYVIDQPYNRIMPNAYDVRSQEDIRLPTRMTSALEAVNDLIDRWQLKIGSNIYLQTETPPADEPETAECPNQ